MKGAPGLACWDLNYNWMCDIPTGPTGPTAMRRPSMMAEARALNEDMDGVFESLGGEDVRDILAYLAARDD